MSQLLDIYRSGSQIRYGYFTLCIRSVGAGNEVRAAAVGVNAKFPARQVFSIFGCFRKVKGCGLIRCRNIKVCRHRIVYRFCFAGHQLLLFLVFPDIEHLTIQIGNLLCRGNQGVRNGSVGCDGQLISADGESQIGCVGKGVLAEDVIAIGQCDAVLAVTVCNQFIGGSGGFAALHKAGNLIMLLHLGNDFIVSIVNSIQIEFCSPDLYGAFQRGNDSIIECGVIPGVGRGCAAPAGCDFPDKNLRCCMTGELLQTQGFCICSSGNFPLTIQQHDTHSFNLFSGEPFQRTGAVGHAAHCCRRSGVSTRFTQHNTGFDAVSDIIVVFISGLIFQIDRIKGQMLLVLHVIEAGNIDAAIQQEHITECVGCANNFCVSNGSNTVIQGHEGEGQFFVRCRIFLSIFGGGFFHRLRFFFRFGFFRCRFSRHGLFRCCCFRR